MKIAYLAVFFMTASLFDAFAQVEICAPPKWVDAEVYSQPVVGETAVTGGYAFTLVDKQYNIGSWESYSHYRLHIVSPEGLQEGSHIAINYDPSYEKVAFHTLVIIRDGKKINRLTSGSFQIIQRERNAEAFLYDGHKSAFTNIHDVRTGDIIEYSFTVTGWNPVFAGKFFTSFYLNFNDPLPELRFRIVAPEGRKLFIKNVLHTHEPAISTDGGTVIYEWSLKDREAIRTEEDAPSWHNPYPFTMITEFSDWIELKRWAVDLFKTRIDHPSIEKQAAEIKASASDTKELAAAVLNFVQNEIRYLGLESGMNSHRPHPPAETIRLRYGDCKDKSLLMAALLHYMDIEAYPALVNTSKARIDQMLPAPSLFDHCVVAVKTDSQYVYFDPTYTLQGGGFDHTFFPDYRFSLPLDPALPQALHKPTSTISGKSVVVEEFSMDELDTVVDFSVKTEYHGVEADIQRRHFQNSSLPQIDRNYLNYYAKNYPGIESVESLKFSDDKVSNIFETSEKYRIANAWQKTENNRREFVVYPQIIRDAVQAPPARTRSMPYQLPYPVDCEQKVVIRLPEPWNINTETIEITNDCVSYKRTVEYEGESVSLTYQYRHLKDVVESYEMQEFIEKQQKIIDDLGYSLTYTPGLVQKNTDVNWRMVFLLILALFGAGYLARKVYNKYDPIPDEHDFRFQRKMIGGWLIVAAFAVIINPFMLLGSLFSSGYFTMKAWFSIRAASDNNFWLGLGLVTEMLLHAGRLVFGVLLVVAFFRRRTSLPMFFIVYLAFTLTTLAFGVFYSFNADFVEDRTKDSAIIRLTAYLIISAILIPYFTYSDRVKETFIKTKRQMETAI